MGRGIKTLSLSLSLRKADEARVGFRAYYFSKVHKWKYFIFEPINLIKAHTIQMKVALKLLVFIVWCNKFVWLVI